MTAGTSREDIRRAIQASGKTQEETAAVVGISPVTLSRWLNGHADPGFDKLDSLADAIGRPIVLVFGHAPDTKEALPPQWARGLVDEVLAAVQASSAESALERIVDRLAARLEPLLLPDDADAHEAGGGPPGAERTRPLPRA